MRKGSRSSNGNVEEVAPRLSTPPDHLRVMETGARLSDQDAFTTPEGEAFTTTADNASDFSVFSTRFTNRNFVRYLPLEA
jgi:hypothetical protein